jgi:hypothetical protein
MSSSIILVPQSSENKTKNHDKLPITFRTFKSPQITAQFPFLTSTQNQKCSLPPSLTHSKCGEVRLRQKHGDQQSASWEHILRERVNKLTLGSIPYCYIHDDDDATAQWTWCTEKSRLVQVKHLPTLPLRTELQQCSICDHCHHAPTRPGPARSGQAHGTGRSGTGLPSAPQQRQQRSPHDGVVVCMCAKCKQNRVRLCTITGLTNSRSIYLSSSTLAGWFTAEFLLFFRG